MIARVGLPGTGMHCATRVATRAEGEAWAARWLKSVGESQESLQAYRDRAVFSERAASKMRWADGRRIYDPEHMALDAALDAAEWAAHPSGRRGGK